jgi:hypothetical protein
MVSDGHCRICLPPGDERARRIYDFTKEFTKIVQQPMRAAQTEEQKQHKLFLTTQAQEGVV